MEALPTVVPGRVAAKQRGRRILAVALGVLLTGVLCEVGFRLASDSLAVDRVRLKDFRDLVVHGRMRGFVPHPYTVFSGGGEDGRYNALGFTGEDWALEAAPGLLRVACLGASTTQSGYPERLEQVLASRTGRAVEVMNCGMSGWTSAESMIAWFLTIRDFRPDVVVIHHAANDFEPRVVEGFRSDYAHFRRPFEVPSPSLATRLLVRWSDLVAWLLMRSNPPTIMTQTTTLGSGARPAREPAPATTFRRNIETLAASAEAGGARVVLMTMPLAPPADDADKPRMRRCVAEHNEILRDLARRRGWGLADAERSFRVNARSIEGVFTDRVHLDARGRLAKAHLVADEILRTLGE